MCFCFPCCDDVDWRFAVRGPTPGAAGRRGEEVSSAMGIRVDQPAASTVGRRRRRGRGRRGRQRVVARNDHETRGHVRSVAFG